MTAEQMKYEFEVAYDRISNFEAPGYTEKEISTFLTKAQEQLVLELYRSRDHYKEDTKKSLNMLRDKTDIVAFATGPYHNSFLANLPASVFLVYNESAYFTTSSLHSHPLASLEDVRVKPIDDDFYHANKFNPYKKPSVRLVWRIDYHTTNDRQHLYVFDSFCTPSKVTVFFYKKPTPIIVAWSQYIVADGSIDGVNWSAHTAASLNCALDSIVHRDIVDRAVQIAFAAAQEERGFQLAAAQGQIRKQS